VTTPSSFATKVEELRSAFDQARATPFSSNAEEQTESLLAVRVSQDAYAVRVAEISGLVTDKKIVAFPSPMSELLGVAGIRGALVPVYSLAALLGYGVDAGQLRWLALCGTEEPLALAFSAFEGYLQIPRAQLYSAEQKDVRRTHVTHVAQAAESVRAVVSISLIKEAIRERCRNGSVRQER
jgi:chemotaxis signal transduction protein